MQFFATVFNSPNVGVTWSIFPAFGTISSTGLYTAPSTITTQQSVQLLVVSTADPTKSVQAVITLVPAISIAVKPDTVILTGGQSQQFTAQVTNAPNSVTWSISPNIGAISAAGLYTAPLVVDVPDTVMVKAVSTIDPSRSGTATITLAANVPLISALGIVNAASFASVSGVSPGLIVTFFGTNMGPAVPATARLNAAGAIDNILGLTRVLFDGTPSPMVAASSGQVSAIVPYSVAARATTQVQVEYQGRRSNSVPLAVVNSAPGVFAANASGRGQAAALNENGSLNSAANPATPGSIMVLFATGEGQTDPIGIDGKLTAVPLPQPQLPVSVSFGGIDGQVLYAGGAPGLTAGLLQINVRVPVNVQPGTEVPLIVNVGSASSQRLVTVTVR